MGPRKDLVPIVEDHSVRELAIDLDNDGTLDRARRIHEFNNYFNGQFWLIAPTGMPSDELDALVAQLVDDPEHVDARRSNGLTIFAGD